MEHETFIEEIVRRDIEEGAYSRPVMTRFAPEPGGYLHIGHARGILASHGIAVKFGGFFNLRLDDTDPQKEYGQFIDLVIGDLRLLGIDPGERVFFTSDYFPRLYEYAIALIRLGRAFVCDLAEEELREYRGDFYTAGKPSPYRDRSVEENLALFEGMAGGKYGEGEKTLRAKIDFNAANVLMRDPVIYRIVETPHYRHGARWRVYPRYDFSHCLSDSIEGVTHSLCGKEFEVHHALYDWFLQALSIPQPPRQVEYAELKLSNTILGKRYLRKLIAAKAVGGWDDPRLLTVRGMRRRGIDPETLRTFFQRVGISRTASLVDIRFLESHCRDRLNRSAPRRFAVLRPLRLVIANYPAGRVEELEALHNPEDPAAGTRKVPFRRELYIERDDFMVDPPAKFYRLAPGREVRLRYAYLITCLEYRRDPATGEIVEITAEYDPSTRGGETPAGRKVKSTLHWLSAREAVPAEVRLYELMTDVEDTSGLRTEEEILRSLRPDSLARLPGAMVEPALALARPGEAFQFERLGYFCLDPDAAASRPVFNRIVTLKDEWRRIQGREPG
jgi:glutaminyl-tRNA synthetase